MHRISSTDDLTKSGRPHWVKALDQGLTHTSYPEYWNRSLKGDVSEDNWRNLKKNNAHGRGERKRSDDVISSTSHVTVAKGDKKALPGRHHSGSLYRSRHSDTASLASRVTSSTDRRQRHRSRRLAAFLILLILAFLLAALLGWLLYYLLMKDDPRADRVIEGPKSHNASVSMRVLNKVYTPQMEDSDSQEFRSISTKLCRKIDDFFVASNLSQEYLGCHVERIRNADETPGCQCYGTRLGNILIDFQLSFNASHNEDRLRWLIYDVIEDGTISKINKGIIYVYVDEFLVDIRPFWTQASYDGLQARVTMLVFNLNFTYMLTNPLTNEFRRLADPFCDDISLILATNAISPFRSRYHSCAVSTFKTRPNRIVFDVHLTGREWRSVQKTLIYVLLMGARNGTYMQHPVKMIGPLAVTPWSYNIDFTIVPINISSITTTSPTISSTPTPQSTPSTSTSPKLIYVFTMFMTYNLTLTPDLRDPTSEEFKAVTNEFCEDLAKLYDLSIYGYRFYSCDVHSFRSDPTSIVVSIGYLGDMWPGMDTSVAWVIRQHAPKFYFDLKELYLVGGIYLLFGEIIANGLELRTNLKVLNLTYASDLADQRSARFRYHSQRFCQDMTKFYSLSYLKDRYFECGVDRFTNNPVKIHFYVVFRGTNMAGLRESIVDVIRRQAPPLYYLMYLAYLVGDILVLPEEIALPPSVYPTNITVMPSTMTSSSMTLTSSIDETTTSLTPSETDDGTTKGIKIMLFYEVYNLTLTDDLKDPTSPRFLEHKHAVCDDLWRWYMGRSSPFLAIYRECDVTSLTPNPTSVAFTMLFETRHHEGFRRAVRSYLEVVAPKVYLPGLTLLDVGNLLLIMDRYIISVTTTTVPSPTLMPPTMTTSSILTTSFTRTSTISSSFTRMTSSKDVMTSTSTIPGLKVILSYSFGLADFIYTTDIIDRTSPRFQYLERRFCKDIDDYYMNSPLKDIYVSCLINYFMQRQRQDYPEKIYFSFVFNAPMFYEVEQQVAAILLMEPPRVPRSGYITLSVGDLFLILDSFTTELPGSITSRNIYTPTDTIASTESPSFAPTPTRTITPTSTTTTTASTSIIPTVTSTYLPTTSTAVTTPTPSITPSPTTPSTPGVSPKPTYFIRMSFETLNLTRESWQNNSSSPEYILVQQYFCGDLENTLNGHIRFIPKFINCSIDSFGGDPLRVNFSLQFRDLEGKSRRDVKDLVVSMLVENAIRKEYNNVYALLVGNLLIAMSSITVEFNTLPPTASVYDAIAYNYTFYLYSGNFSRDLLDTKSQYFNVTAYKFCQDVDELFANVGLRTLRSRYHGCAVNEFGRNGEIKFTVSLTDPLVIRPSTMFNIFAYSSDQQYLDGIFYLKLGDLFYAVDPEPTFYLLMLERFVTHPYPYSTTQAPNVNTIITLTLDVLQPDWSVDLSDVNSARYRLFADSFCNNVSAWISEWKNDFIRCSNVRFSQNPFQITTELWFRGLQESTLESVLNTIILERAAWLPVANMYAMKIGELLIYDKSLILTQRTVSVRPDSTPSTGDVTTAAIPSTTPSPTTSQPQSTTPGDPCVGASAVAIVPHPSQCDRFFRCVRGRAYPISCMDGMVFQDGTCVAEPPGFVCRR